MRKLQSILLATDFGTSSQEARKVAVKLASVFGSRVTLLHAIEPLPNWPVALHEQQKEGPLQEVASELTGHKVEVAESSIVVGPSADTILRKAQEMDADLILIGAGERVGVFRFSSGTIAQTVIEHAPQPVLAVRSGEPELNFRKILCPVDQSGASWRGLRNAIQLARVFGGELVVFTVVPDVSWLSAAMETGQFAGAKAEYDSKWHDEFEKFLTGIAFDGVKVKKEVRQGTPHQQIIAAAEDHQADVIIMGATGRTGLVRVLLGSTTRHVLQQLPCSLLVVKEEDVVEQLFEGDLQTINRLMAEARELMAAGSHLTATTKFRQVLARNPFHVAAVEGLAEAHETLGHGSEAASYRRLAAKLRQGSPA